MAAELCPRPFNSRPDGFTADECIAADECGCDIGTARRKTADRYSHHYDCTLSDGTPYRLAVVKGSSEREVHVEDAERMFDALHADLSFAERNWLVLFMLPSPADWPRPSDAGLPTAAPLPTFKEMRGILRDPSEDLPSGENVPDVP